MQSAWKVGLFAVVFGGLMLGAYALLEKSVFAKPVDVYYAQFKDAGGVATGSAVLLSGVKVGQVKAVSLDEQNLARLTLEVDHGTRIPKGSKVMIPASFISLGDQKLQLVLPKTRGDYLVAGDTMQGTLGSPLDSFAPEGQQTLGEINKTLVSIRGLLDDKGLRGDLSELLRSVNATTKKFGGMADSVNGLVAQNSSKFGNLLNTTAGTLQNLQAVSAEVRKLVASGEMQGKTTALLDNLNSAVLQGQKLVSEMHALVADPEMRASLKGTLENVKVMSDSGTKIASNAELMSKDGIEITGETKKLMVKANALADKVQDLIDKFNSTVGKLGGQGKSFADNIGFETTLARESNPGRTRVDANVSVPIGKDKVVFGLYDAFEGNKVNLQLQKQVKKNLGLRYGAYASKPGIGVDYDVASKFGLRADLFGLNEPRLDVRLNYQVAKGVFGWAGVNNMFEKASPSIGVTVRK